MKERGGPSLRGRWGKGVTYPVIGLEVVNLLLEEDGPQVFAEELDHVEVIDEAGTVAGESGDGERGLLVSMLFPPVFPPSCFRTPFRPPSRCLFLMPAYPADGMMKSPQ